MREMFPYLCVHDANAAVGVFRAAIRATVVDPSGPPISELITVGMRRLRSCFNALTAE